MSSFCLLCLFCSSCSFHTKTQTSATSKLISAIDKCICINSATSFETYMLSLQVSVAECRTGRQLSSFYMHREVTAAAVAIREIPPGNRRGPCRDRVNPSSSVHSAFGLALWPGTSPAGPCTSDRGLPGRDSSYHSTETGSWWRHNVLGCWSRRIVPDCQNLSSGVIRLRIRECEKLKTKTK